MKIGELSLDEAANQAAGNWQSFHCFVWFRDRELNDADQWAIIYTHNRDSGLLDQSNAAVIEKAMKMFTEGDDPDVVFESHHHWAVGHVDGFSVRVFKNGEITTAFETYHDLARQLDDYPILDESDYSEREYEATLENIEDAAWRVKHEFDLPEDWASQVYGWLSDNRCGEIENVDDQGGYPSEEALKAAFDALGFEPSKDTAST
jgi:hypothetical protein